MSLTGSRTTIRRSVEQWRKIQQRFEHSGQTQVAFCATETTIHPLHKVLLQELPGLTAYFCWDLN